MGGRAFEMFIELMGRWATMQEWNAEITRLRGFGSDGPIAQAAEDTILCRESSAFHGFMLMSCARLARKCKQQLFNLSFSLRFHGLSRNGLSLAASHGFAMKLTTYDKMEKKAQEIAKKKMR